MIKCRVLTKDGYKDELAYTPKEFSCDLLKAKALHRSEYIAVPATLDIETSRILHDVTDNIEHYESFMYIWQMCIEGYVVIGRYWQELIRLFEDLEAHYNLHPKRKLVIYVHNLSYEFQFMKTFIDFVDVFAMDRHEILNAKTETLEFRCSYLLSNMSLAKFLENTPNVYHLKAKGDLDYSVLRTPTTVLSRVEYGYCYNDVIGLYEALLEMLKYDTLKTIKLTSTGFVRRDCRTAMSKNKKNRKRFLASRLDLELYKLCKECFRGGNTASNRYHTNVILDNVKSYDISSSYPFAMVAYKYPDGPFMSEDITSNEMLEEYNSKYCTMGRYIFTNIIIKRKAPIPYIPISKVLASKGIEPGDVYNGRVMQADMLAIALTNVDYDIIKSMYDFDEVKVVDYFYAYAEYLPAELTDCIFDYFAKKSKLKGVKGSEYEYMKAKNKLNGIYGMSVTDMIHATFIYNEHRELEPKVINEADKEEALNKFYKSRNSFLCYQTGVWVTAYARRALQRAIDAVGLDVVYCDTDSVKYIGDHDAAFAAINDNIRCYCNQNKRKHSIDVNGKVYEMGVFDKELKEYDGACYKRFKTLGAKKYCYEVSENGKVKLGITVAGLDKTRGAEVLEADGGISNFKIGKVFNPGESGRKEAQYREEGLHILHINNEDIITGASLSIVDTTYTLGMTKVMLGILEDL